MPINWYGGPIAPVPRKRDHAVKASIASSIRQGAGRDRDEGESVRRYSTAGPACACAGRPPRTVRSSWKLELRHGSPGGLSLRLVGLPVKGRRPVFRLNYVLLSCDLRSQRRGRENQKRNNTEQMIWLHKRSPLPWTFIFVLHRRAAYTDMPLSYPSLPTARGMSERRGHDCPPRLRTSTGFALVYAGTSKPKGHASRRSHPQESDRLGKPIRRIRPARYAG